MNDSSALRRYRLLLAALVLGYFGISAVYPALFFAMGVNHLGVWFLDTFALLASSDAVARGLDPYVPNPLDYFHRPHVYPHWWLYLGDLGLTRADAGWLGFAIVLAFLGAALVRLRPRSAGEILWYASILCSAPVLLAVDRANNDLVIFALLAPVVPCLLSPRRGFRHAASFLVAIAAALKYYPAAAALVLLAGWDRAESRRRIAVAAALLTLAAVATLPDLVVHSSLMPVPKGLLSFGAAAFFRELGWIGWAPILACGLVGAAWTMIAWRRRWLEAWVPDETQRSAWWTFVLGAALLTGCFFSGLNFGYRWIFAIWLGPLLWTLPTDVTAPLAVRRLARWTRGLLVAVLWWDPLCCRGLNALVGKLPEADVAAYARGCFLVEQPLDWVLFVLLLVFLAHFARKQVRWLFSRRT